MTIGIIGAMAEEITLLKELMTVEKESVIATITFYEGQIAGKNIVLCKSGVGKVNAAITTQILIDQFHVQKIIFTGVAGALDPKLDVSDIVISTSALQHDIDASALGFKRGEIPMFEHDSIFTADADLVALASKAAESLPDVHVVQGRVLSGDQFIANEETVSYLFEQFDGTCVEMEGAAVAHAAQLNGIPFVIIRSMSDKANGEANINFQEFTNIAAKNSYKIVKGMFQG